MIVTCNPYFNCGHCYSCKNGIVNACMDNQTMGCQRDGAFQEYITMPSERVYDGKGIDPMLLAVIEPFCISYHGVSRAEVGTGEKVLVIGAGTIAPTWLLFFFICSHPYQMAHISLLMVHRSHLWRFHYVMAQNHNENCHLFFSKCVRRI